MTNPMTMQSHGKCEVCGHSKVCFDINSGKLVPKIKYPENHKLDRLQPKNLVLSEFLDFLEEKNIILCVYDKDHYDGKFPKPFNISKSSLMYQFFDIDEKVMEQEKAQMLEEQRMLNTVGTKWNAYGDTGRKKMYLEAMGVEYSLFIVHEWGDLSLNDRVKISKYYDNK